MKTWATLKPDTSFNQLLELFPDGKVPIKSMVPFIPREAGSPACYEVDAKFLTPEQMHTLAQALYEMWQPECESVQMAVDCINKGLPLRCDHFSGVTTTDQVVFSMMLDEPVREDVDDDFDYAGEGICAACGSELIVWNEDEQCQCCEICGALL